MTKAGVPAHRAISPRPFAFHLAACQSTWLSGAAALPAFVQGLAPTHSSLAAEAAALRQDLCAAEGVKLAEAVMSAALARVGAFLNGVNRYQTHPAHRRLQDAPAALELGTSCLRDFGGPAGALPVLAAPSLVNPAHILDLERGMSLMRYLKQRGFHPFLMDWGAPGAAEADFSVDDYIARLETALAHVAAQTGQPAALLGYCMGGNLALPVALRRPELVRGAAFLATPWDFHAEGIAYRRAVAAALGGSLALLPPAEPVPVDVLQIFFASLDPTLTDRKFRRFAVLDPDSPAARAFVLMEDWANGGAPLPRRVADQCLNQWYAENAPGRGVWRVAGEVIDPHRLICPAFVAVPRADRIVPPASALALAEALPNVRIHRAATGHVAMVAGGGARPGLWQPLVAWLFTLC